jgi:ABC-type multidrug transport system ATPase subunit
MPQQSVDVENFDTFEDVGPLPQVGNRKKLLKIRKIKAKDKKMLSWNLSLTVNLPKGSSDSSSTLVTNKNNKDSNKKGQLKGPPTKKLLDGVTGKVESGQMMALMGSSGAGKSTLLDCISLRNQKFDGEVYVNGVPVDETFFTQTAYVYQDDLFFPTLTVREHLRFHAMVRMPEFVDEDDKFTKVEEIIRNVGLSGCADGLIGGSNSLIRGLSGGERKRVSVATELLSDPSILFLDEPTSGLDAFMADSVCMLLRKLANSGKIVICVIHQPSTDTFNLFTHLCLLAKGRLAYLGALDKAVTYFSSLGNEYSCPDNYNPADFFIEKLAVIPNDYENSVKKLYTITDAYAASKLATHNNRWLKTINDQVDTPSSQNSDQSSSSDGTRKPLAIAITDYAASWNTQFNESCKRTLLQYKREPVLTRARMGNALAMGTLIGIVYFGQDNTSASVQNKLGVAFIMTINQSISSMLGVTQEVPRDFAVFLREYLAGANRVSTYFAARTVAEIPYQIFFPMLFATLVYFMVGFNPDFAHFIVFAIIMILTANAAVSLGYALSAIFRNSTSAIAAAAVIILPMTLFSGLLIDQDNISPVFAPIGWVSLIKYAYHAILINEYANEEIYCGTNLLCTFRSGNAVLAYIGANPNHLWLNIFMLFFLMILFRLIAWYALHKASTVITSNV